MTALRCSGHLEEAGSQFSGLEVLEKLFTECRELASWLGGRGFDVEGILEEGEELVDNALWLYWLLRDVLAGNCKLADAWRGKQGSACEDLEAMYFECVHRDTEGRVERYKRAAVRIGHHTIVTEIPEHTNAR
ncbi:MAG: hypothetical protein LM590_10325 [Thermofilum sp.]|nr:hypothetical protein [Thermofilum sp.]